MHGVLKKLVIALVLLAGMFAGAVTVQSLVERKTATDVMAQYGLPFVPSPQAAFGRDRIALLLMGIDYNYNAKDIAYSGKARTDTIKAVALNFPTAANPNGSVAILSVPRDMAYTYPDGHQDKINSAYSQFEDTNRAAHASEAAVASFLAVPGFDKYVTLRIDATKDLVDAIGGIDVVPDETMNYDDSWGHLHIHFVGGKHYHMTGEQAVSYARFRHDACSDPCRIKRQDQVIRLTMAKLKSDKFNDLLHINALIDVVRKNVYTDLTQSQIVSLAWAFQHVDVAKLDTRQVPYTGDKSLACCGDVLIADDAVKARFVKKMFLDPIVPVPTADPVAVAAVEPSTVRVVVENGTGITGQGMKLAAALRKAGFVVASVTNADSFDHDATDIRVSSTARPLAGERVRSALALPGATVEPAASTLATPAAGDVVVIVGRDFSAPAGTSPARAR